MKKVLRFGGFQGSLVKSKLFLTGQLSFMIAMSRQWGFHLEGTMVLSTDSNDGSQFIVSFVDGHIFDPWVCLGSCQKNHRLSMVFPRVLRVLTHNWIGYSSKANGMLVTDASHTWGHLGTLTSFHRNNKVGPST